MNEQILINFKSVRYATLHWRNKFNTITIKKKPRKPTVNGQEVSSTIFAIYHPSFPGETELERARRLRILDEWIPVCHLEFAAHRRLKFEGKEALKMWQAYRSHIYGRPTKVQGKQRTES